jgi:uncharacterized membrane protein YphA (DoxX/SURF4 family)
MKNMDDSMAYPGGSAVDLPAWKNAVSTVSAVILALLFASAGVWKIVDPIDWSARLAQMKVPGGLALPFTLALGISETVAAVLLIVPRFRRWGAWLTGLLLVAFMAYVAWNYEALTGADCSCFPWLKRTIGPGFFYSDALMLVAAVLAGWWAQRSRNVRGALLVLASVTVFAGVSYGVAAARQTGAEAPETITVAGESFNLREGKVLLYFFDPECMHCFQAAQEMSKHTWQAKVVAIPTRVPQFAQGFLNDTGLEAPISSDLELLKKTFPFGDAPYAVAIENGRQKAAMAIFDGRQPTATLRELGFIE